MAFAIPGRITGSTGVPTGIRTPVTAVKGRCPRPLDDGGLSRVSGPASRKPEETWWSQTGSNRRPLACHASALPAELWPRAAYRGGGIIQTHTPTLKILQKNVFWAVGGLILWGWGLGGTASIYKEDRKVP